jgi:hypothetical protein
MLRPFHPHIGNAAGRVPLRRLLPGAFGLALLVLGLSGITANAAVPANCVPISQTACIANGITYSSNPNAIYSNAPANTTVAAPSTAVYAPTTAAYAPTYAAYAPSGSGYPPNTVVSSYFDPRYGPVSVVTDQYGNLIDVNSATGQRIYPVYGDYGYGYPGGYANGYYANGFYGGCQVGNYTCLRTYGYYGP